MAEQIGKDMSCMASWLCRRCPPVSMQADYTIWINVRRCRVSNGLNCIRSGMDFRDVCTVGSSRDGFLAQQSRRRSSGRLRGPPQMRLESEGKGVTDLLAARAFSINFSSRVLFFSALGSLGEMLSVTSC